MFIEWFCGIGGLAACLPECESAWSIDINQKALQVHALNFSHQRLCKTIESINLSELENAPLDFWWMSPPCQPYTRRGKRSDADDPRAAALHHLIELIAEQLPTNLGLENVPGFATSRSRKQLLAGLAGLGYHLAERLLCPTELGARNRRRRYYLIASRDKLHTWRVPSTCGTLTPPKPKLETEFKWLDFAVPNDWLRKYADAIQIIDEDVFLNSDATTSCFTSAYGRSPVRSGSYLRCAAGIRLFTPREVLWQLGFPASFVLPGWRPQRLWPLVGNSLSLPAVRYLLQHLPGPRIASPVQPPSPL